MKVVPAIIPHLKEQLVEEINKVASFSPLIQIDISDGIFTQNKTWPYNGRDVEYFKNLISQTEGWPKWDNLDIEVHLMVAHPEEVVLDWIQTGVSGVVAHIEATENFQKVIDVCREHEVSVGVAIKPGTDVEKVKPFIESVDFIQVMGSDYLGEHGFPLDKKAIEMLKTLHLDFPEKTLAIDIGVNEETKEELVSAGASKLISGGAILNAPNPQEVYNYLIS